MTIKTVKLARRVFYVEGVQVTHENMIELATWCGGEIKKTTPKPNGRGGTPKDYIHLDIPRATNPRQTMAFVGDWILSTTKGFKVYHNQALFKDFSRVDEEAPARSYNPRQPALHSVRKLDDEDAGYQFNGGETTGS